MKKIAINKNLLIVIVGQFLSQFGDKIYLLALTYWVLDTTKSSAATGIALFSSMAPATIIGFVLGGFVDRHNRKSIMIMTDIIRGCVIGIVSVLFYLNFLNLYVVIIAQVLLSVCAAFSDPAVFAIMPMIVERESLSKAIAKSQLVDGVTTIIGPILGGIGIAFWGYGAIFITNGLSFFMSAALERFIKLPPNILQNKEEKESINTYTIIDGYKYIFQRKKLKIIIGIVVIGHFVVGALQIIMPILSKIIEGNGAQNLGYIQTAFGIGAVVASLLLAIINISKREEKLMFGSIIAIGCTYIVFGAVNSIGVISIMSYLVIILLFGSIIIFAATCYQVVLQNEIDDSMKGRVYAIVNSIGDSTIPIGILIYGILLDYAKLYWATFALGFIIIPLAILLYIKFR